jgi:hypothetical protein
MGHACFIEQIEKFAQRLLIPPAAKRIAEMIMRIYDRELRFVHQSRVGDELGFWTKVF